jgi:hypothetical protein
MGQVDWDAMPEGRKIDGTIPSDKSVEAKGKGRNSQEGSLGTNTQETGLENENKDVTKFYSGRKSVRERILTKGCR